MTLHDAIVSACGRGLAGRLSHQWCISNEALDKFLALLTSTPTVRRMRRASDFDSLLSIVEKLGQRVYGVGEMTTYDAARLIGANLRLDPERVYLHRGARQGAKALGFSGSRRSIAISELPAAFRRLGADEIEDCLCIFKENLTRIRRSSNDVSAFHGAK